ncbi:hypothetical protein BSKO_05890 [Bryopsis sp. KO-2023]|nr:hypothetical protein BSKO_05890 [Bryopsis sp. KO-2023]
MHPMFPSAAIVAFLSVAAGVGATSGCGKPAEFISKFVPLGPSNVFSPLDFMVGVLGKSSQALCTGVLIGPQIVAISATCIHKRLDQQPFKASIGGLNIGEQDGEEGYSCYGAPDIALLFLSSKSSAQPIPILPDHKWMEILSDAEVDLEIFGWFSTDQKEFECLGKAHTKSMSWGNCENTITRKDVAKASGLRCSEAPDTALWFWDVGAPLIYSMDGKKYLVGLWSYEDGRCGRNSNMRPESIVYTPLPPLRAWIEFAPVDGTG